MFRTFSAASFGPVDMLTNVTDIKGKLLDIISNI